MRVPLHCVALPLEQGARHQPLLRSHTVGRTSDLPTYLPTLPTDLPYLSYRPTCATHRPAYLPPRVPACCQARDIATEALVKGKKVVLEYELTSVAITVSERDGSEHVSRLKWG